MASSYQPHGQASSPNRSKVKITATKVKCTFCGNTFYARPKEAVCPKCERPANRDLEPLLRAAALVAPPFGLICGLVIRPHSPVAGVQSLLFSAIGALIYGAVYVAKFALPLL